MKEHYSEIAIENARDKMEPQNSKFNIVKIDESKVNFEGKIT
jgi:hypothetical protein